MVYKCKELAERIKENAEWKVRQFCERPPFLVIVQVGDNEASNRYIKGKLKDCEDVGITAHLKKFPEEVTQKELNDYVFRCGESKYIDGIIVQLPLPDHIDEKEIIRCIPKHKDVDGFRGSGWFKPCTPSGVMKIISDWGIDLAGKNVVLVGYGNVGKPLSTMLMDTKATVTVCNSKTKNLSYYTANADLIISCAGKANLITPEMIREGVYIVDVGINFVDGKMCGDVSKECYDKAKYQTAVPGGVGLMTRAMLIENTVKAYQIAE